MTARYLPQELLRRKRDGEEFRADEIEDLVAGIASGTLRDEQVGALAMAIFLKGASTTETVALTQAMCESGSVLSWKELEGPVVDKHSTGGVGDKLSLLVAPILAANGAFVPMVSGRALGHTGGTLDKLDSISGYSTRPNISLFRQVVRHVGCAIVGQTDDIAPADRRLYSIRDTTGTVESIPLIVSSILSKKLAAGVGTLVLDVKFGTGAFLNKLSDANVLARELVNVARGAGMRCSAVITNMSRCLGRTAGNSLEVTEATKLLSREIKDTTVEKIVHALCGQALFDAGLARSQEEGVLLSTKALEEGEAAERFARMVSALGGPTNFLERPQDFLPSSEEQRAVIAESSGYVQQIDARELGIAIVELGGGRAFSNQTIDHSVGLSHVKAPGERVDQSEPLAVLHSRDAASAQMVMNRVRSAFMVSPDFVEPASVVEHTIGGGCY